MSDDALWHCDSCRRFRDEAIDPPHEIEVKRWTNRYQLPPPDLGAWETESIQVCRSCYEKLMMEVRHE